METKDKLEQQACERSEAGEPIGVKRRRLQMLASARRRQGLSIRCVAARLGCSSNEVRAQERESADLWISELYRWREALEVPVQELLEEPSEELARGVGARAQLLRLMKTARSLQAAVQSRSLSCLTLELIRELIEIMPELAEIPAWPSVGQRRTSDEYGRTALHTIAENMIHGAVP